jgi:hypothetical protein
VGRNLAGLFENESKEKKKNMDEDNNSDLPDNKLITSTKFVFVVNFIVNNLKMGEKLVIFSQWVGVLDILEKVLNNVWVIEEYDVNNNNSILKYKYIENSLSSDLSDSSPSLPYKKLYRLPLLRFDGTQTAPKQTQVLNSFDKKPNITILLASMKAGVHIIYFSSYMLLFYVYFIVRELE